MENPGDTIEQEDLTLFSLPNIKTKEQLNTIVAKTDGDLESSEESSSEESEEESR